MSQPLFNIVFYGIIQPGKVRSAVLAEMAALFKTTPEKIKPYFSGDRKVIKSNVDDLGAEKYRVMLEKIGLIIKIEPAASAQSTKTSPVDAASKFDTGDLSLAEPGAKIIEKPARVTPQPVSDISGISLAEVGANVLTEAKQVTPAVIDDISTISMAEPGADVLEHPVKVTPQPIADISDISVAEPGADVLKNPPEKKAAPIPDISKLSLKD